MSEYSYRPAGEPRASTLSYQEPFAWKKTGITGLKAPPAPRDFTPAAFSCKGEMAVEQTKTQTVGRALRASARRLTFFVLRVQFFSVLRTLFYPCLVTNPSATVHT